MPKIDPGLLQAVFYIYPSKEDATQNTESGATGFFYGVLSGDKIRSYYYAVTNSHVVYRDGMEKPVLRINTTEDKFDVIETSREDWFRHPDGDDLAVYPIQDVPNKAQIACFTEEFLADERFLKEFTVGPGDDVFMIGRFRVHAGKTKNLPTVRFGNVAALNNEAIYNSFTQLNQESYMVEMRSVAGFSGSPVMLYIHPLVSPRHPGGSTTRLGDLNNMTITIEQKLLGIQWGQISYKSVGEDENGQKYKITVDSAMEGVVPVQKLIDLIYGDELVEQRRISDEIHAARRKPEE